MAVSDAPITSYSDTTAHKRSVSDLISILDPMDTPFVSYFGRNGDPGKFAIVNWPATNYEWLEDTYSALSDTLAASLASDSTTAQVTDGTLHNVGNVELVGTEKVWVSAISTNTLTITRGLGDTSAASHANAATLSFVGNARLEGAAATYDYKTDVTASENYTTIIQRGIYATRTAAKLKQYGIEDEYQYQLSKKVPEAMRMLNRIPYYGEDLAGSASTPRSAGGLQAFISDNTASLSGAALTEKDLVDRIEACWSDGGNPNLIVCNSWVQRKITSFFEDSVRTTRDESVGGVTIDKIHTHFGDLSILRDRACQADTLYILDDSHIGFLAFDDFFEAEIGRTGDYIQGEVIGEFGFVVRHDKAHAYISSISTSS